MTSHDEIRELLGVFALDAVEGEELDAVAVHLRYCPQCRAEVAEFREVAAMIGHGGAAAPEGVWDRIVEALELAPPRMRIEVDESGSGSVVPFAPRAPASSARSVPTRIFVATVAAAAVIVAVMGLVVVEVADQRPEGSKPDIQEVADAALVAPGVRKTQLRSSDRTLAAEAAVAPDGQGYLLAGAMPRLPEDRTYQLWGTVGAETISLGTFAGGVGVVPFRVDPSVDRLAVTRERAGGVPVAENPLLLTGDIPA
ncbi:MAG: anti-sigma factor [Acidimicrobiales bacterium]